MTAQDWLAALALVLVLEGLLPFVAPAAWRETMLRLASLPESRLRLMGALLMGAGLLLTLFLPGS